MLQIHPRVEVGILTALTLVTETEKAKSRAGLEPATLRSDVDLACDDFSLLSGPACPKVAL